MILCVCAIRLGYLGFNAYPNETGGKAPVVSLLLFLGSPAARAPPPMLPSSFRPATTSNPRRLTPRCPPYPQGSYEGTLTATDGAGAPAACLSFSIQIESSSASSSASPAAAASGFSGGGGGEEEEQEEEAAAGGAGSGNGKRKGQQGLRAAARLTRGGGAAAVYGGKQPAVGSSGGGARGLRWAWERISGMITQGFADIRGGVGGGGT